MALPLLIMDLAAFHGLLPLVINTHRSCVLLSWRERSANEEKRMGSEQYGAEGNYRIPFIIYSGDSPRRCQMRACLQNLRRLSYFFRPCQRHSKVLPD